MKYGSFRCYLIEINTSVLYRETIVVFYCCLDGFSETVNSN